jgi:hypothetical protein
MQEDQNNRRVINLEAQLFHAVEIKSPAQAERHLSRKRVSADCRDDKGRTPLMKASETGDAAMVGLLLRHRADPNAVDSEGETSLVKAAFGGYLDVVELLMSHGADGDLRNNEGMTALEIAQEMEHDDVAAFLSAQSAGSTTSIIEDTSTDPNDDSLTAYGPAGVAVSVAIAPAMAPSPAPQSYVQDLDLESIPDLENSPYFKAQEESQIVTEDGEEAATMLPQEDESEPAADSTGTGDRAEEAWDKIQRQQDTLLGSNATKAPPVPAKFVPPLEERIEFDALDNKQVRNINEKIKKVLDRASFEVGDYVIDTVFKGSYMAVLKPRSQENKRWRKLKKHPERIYDPRRLTEMVGGCAVKRLCLAEGIEVSSLSLSHFIELYYAKDLKMILTLAEEASTNKYSVRQLKKAVDDLREHKDDHDPGREIIRTLDQPVPILEDPDLLDLCTDKDRVLVELSKPQRKRIRVLLKARKPALDESKKIMDTLERILSDLEDE